MNNNDNNNQQSVDTNVTSQDVKNEVTNEQQNVQNNNPAQNLNNSLNTGSSNPKKNGKIWIIFIVVAAVVIAVTIILALVFKNDDEDGDSFSTNNTSETKSQFIDNLITISVEADLKSSEDIINGQDLDEDVCYDISDLDIDYLNLRSYKGHVVFRENGDTYIAVDSGTYSFEGNVSDADEDTISTKRLKNLTCSSYSKNSGSNDTSSGNDNKTSKSTGTDSSNTFEVKSLKTSALYGIGYSYDKLPSVLNNSKGSFYSSDNVDSGLKYELSNNKLTVSNDSTSFSIDNVSKAFYSYYVCGGYVYLFVQNSEGVTVGNVRSDIDKLEFKVEEVYKNLSIDDVYQVYINTLPCDANYEYVIKNNDGSYSYLDGKKFTDKVYRNYIACANSSECDDLTKVMNIKASFSNPGTGMLEFAISEDRYLYNLNDKNELVKVKNSKVSKFSQYDYGYNFILDDGSAYSVDYYMDWDQQI